MDKREIIKFLLRNRELIRSGVVYNIGNMTVFDYDDVVYMTVLSIEAIVEKLYKEGRIDDIEYAIFNNMGDGATMEEIGRRVGRSRINVHSKIESLIEKLIPFLGDEEE